MVLRILADRESYAAFADQVSLRGFSLVFGPPPIDSPEPDIVVLPASDFLSLARRGGLPQYIPYGPVKLMAAAFARGCLDYLREPWSLAELFARAGRQIDLRFQADGERFRLEGSRLLGEAAWVELDPEALEVLRLLLRCAPFPVARQAMAEALAGQGAPALPRRPIAELRRQLERLDPGLGRKVKSVKGLGYRFDGVRCG